MEYGLDLNNAEINRGSPLPLYKQVAKILRKAIINCVNIKSDMPIPPERDLARIFKIQQPTIRQALGELVKEDLIYKIRGKGTFFLSFSTKSCLSTFFIKLLQSNKVADQF